MMQFLVEKEKNVNIQNFSCLAWNGIIPAPEDVWFCRAYLLSLT